MLPTVHYVNDDQTTAYITPISGAVRLRVDFTPFMSRDGKPSVWIHAEGQDVLEIQVVA
jgi:hypothetical protein